jgi:hypothetical protein
MQGKQFPMACGKFVLNPLALDNLSIQCLVRFFQL